MMTPEEFCERMRAIFGGDGWDEESAHVEADVLMCKLLQAMGYGDGVAVFEAAANRIWYA